VRLLIKSTELSDKFLGYDKEMTLMEADCVLLGLNEHGQQRRQLSFQQQLKQTQQQQQEQQQQSPPNNSGTLPKEDNFS